MASFIEIVSLLTWAKILLSEAILRPIQNRKKTENKKTPINKNNYNLSESVVKSINYKTNVYI